MASVKERGPCAFCDVAETSLRDPILVVRADTAKRNRLLGQLDSPDECGVAIVTMIMLNLNAMR